jgi:hypothetical protein
MNGDGEKQNENLNDNYSPIHISPDIFYSIQTKIRKQCAGPLSPGGSSYGVQTAISRASDPTDPGRENRLGSEHKNCGGFTSGISYGETFGV